MANQRIPDLTADASRADTDEYIVHKSGETRAKKQTGAVVRGGLTPTTRTISTTSPLSGGGDLSANRTLSISNVTGLTGQLADPQPTTVRKNSGANVGSQVRLNFIEGSNVTLTVTNDAANGEIDITIAATSGGAVTERWARVRKSANQALSANTATALTWDTEDFDTDGFHDNVTNNTRLTIPSGQAGRYQIEAAVRFAILSSGQRMVTIMKNGTTYLIGATSAGMSVISTFGNCTTIVDLAVGDYVELITQTTVATDALTDEATHFTIRKVS